MLCCVFWLVSPKCLGGKSRRQVSAASTYDVWMRSLQHPRGWLDMQYLAHPFDGMCNVVVPPCFPLCYIGTLCGLANSPICQHPLCLDFLAWGFTWIDDPRNIVDYVDRRSTDYFRSVWRLNGFDGSTVFVDRRSMDYCWSLLNIDATRV